MTGWGGRKAQRFTALVLAVYGDVCWLCGQRGATTADHVVPLQWGGDPYAISNGRPAHLLCNQQRGNRTRHAAARARPLRPNRVTRQW